MGSIEPFIAPDANDSKGSTRAVREGQLLRSAMNVANWRIQICQRSPGRSAFRRRSSRPERLTLGAKLPFKR